MPFRSRGGSLVTLLLAGAVEMPLRSQSPARADQTYTSAATAILVDVVVRDRKGRPVTDLDAADFELSEDGVAQKVDTFSRVSRGGGIGVDVAWRSPANTTSVMTSRPSGPADKAPTRPRKRRSRWCSIASLPSRCGSRSAPRSTTSRCPATRRCASVSSPQSRACRCCSATRPTASSCAARSRGCSLGTVVRPGQGSNAPTNCEAQRRTLETQNATSAAAAGSTSGADAGAQRHGDRRA